MTRDRSLVAGLQLYRTPGLDGERFDEIAPKPV
jgi:hypothetical protein